MPPAPMFQRLSFDPDTTRAMGLALASRLIARRIVALARGGEHDRTRPCRATLAHFGLDGGGDGCAPA